MRPVRTLLLLAALGAWALPPAATALTPAQFTLQRGSGLRVAGAVGTVYAIQASTNLARPDAWRCLALLKLTNSTYLVSNTVPTNSGRQFYRAVAMSRTNMVFLSPGSFTMGSPLSEVDRAKDEGPQGAVTLSQGFWMALGPVTQGEYQSVMTNNPSRYTGDLTLPVEQVTWTEATNYCALLTARDVAAGRIPAGLAYRLPTEAEWEYACRAGTTNRFYYGDDPGYTNLASHAWYWDNSASHTHPVGQKAFNPWGLYDMCGNVWEWCQDWYGPYSGLSATDPQGPADGQYRVLRGGSWYDWAKNLRSACRCYDDPDWVSDSYGFRIVLAPASH
jgi:formylglycine-generating enzyme required for sulfatase activity